MDNIVIWADIPVADMGRAVAFYSAVTQQPVAIMPETNDTVAVIGNPANPIVSLDLYVGGKPTHDGATVYLNPGGDIDAALARVEPAGGKILQEKQFMGPIVGWVALFEDTEGNRIGFQQAG